MSPRTRLRFTLLHRLVRNAEPRDLEELFPDGWDTSQIVWWLMTEQEPDCCSITLNEHGEILDWLALAAYYRRNRWVHAARDVVRMARDHRLDHGRTLP